MDRFDGGQHFDAVLAGNITSNKSSKENSRPGVRSPRLRIRDILRRIRTTKERRKIIAGVFIIVYDQN